MLIPLCNVLELRPEIKSALVIGAGELEQKREFDLCGLTNVTWVEARPWAVSAARSKYPHADIHTACVAIKADKTVKFWEQCAPSAAWSSILEPLPLLTKTCAFARVRGFRFFRTKLLDTFLCNKQADMLQLDISGAELNVLAAATCSLPHVVHLKVFRESCFSGGATVDKVDAYFDAIGYTCIAEQWAPNALVGEKVYAF